MKFQETETVELKAVAQDGIKKEIVAFANSNGGTVYVGVGDDGTILGVEDADGCALQVSNMVRDAVRPDATMFVSYETLDCDGKAVVAVKVQRGTNRPYYMAKKGLRPEGVYVRQGYSSVPATDAAIRQMIKETDGDSFEDMRSLDQGLTFESTKGEFEARNIPFGSPQMQTLKITSSDGLYTNLGLLLSDQCPHTIKAAVFEGTDQSVFKDRREFSGSPMRQLGEAYDYIDFHNQTHATFRKLLRVDTRDYPEVAVREALLNSLVHRDYSFHASTLISIYDDRIEFVSVGGLLPGLELEDLMMGVSACRNPHLANVFYRLQLIEAYGTGMRKIMGAYASAATQPQIIATNNAFKIVLPNVNFTATKAKEPAANSTETPSASHSREDEILRFLAEHPSITRKEAQALLEVSQSTAGRILRWWTRGKSQRSAQAAPCDTNWRNDVSLRRLPAMPSVQTGITKASRDHSPRFDSFPTILTTMVRMRRFPTGQAPLSPSGANHIHPSPEPSQKDPESPWCDNASHEYAFQAQHRTPDAPGAGR